MTEIMIYLFEEAGQYLFLFEFFQYFAQKFSVFIILYFKYEEQIIPLLLNIMVLVGVILVYFL